MDTVKLKDFLTYHFLSSPSFIKEDVVFISKTADEKNNCYSSDLMLMKKDGSVKRLTTCKKVSAFTSFGDGILFTSSREKEKGKDKNQDTDFFRIETEQGEAEKVFSLKQKVKSFQLLDENTLLVHYIDNFKTGDCGWHELEAYPFCENGGGFISRETARLALYDIKQNVFSPISPRAFKVSSYFLSEDRTKILITGAKWKDHVVFSDNVYEIDIPSKKVRAIMLKNGWQIERAVYLDSFVLAVATDMKAHGLNQNPDFYKIEDGKMVLFRRWGEAVRSSVGSDCRLGGGNTDAVYDGRYFFTTTLLHHSSICSIDKNGKIFIPPLREGSVDSFTLEDGHIASVEMRDGLLQEIYLDGECASEINMPFFAEKTISKCELLKFENDGITLYGWVIKPVGYEEGKTYPAILDIHGGPKTVYGETYFHEMQYWAAHGYFVMFTNPRGSDGRGDDFADIRGKYGTIDFSDIMAFVDAVLAKYPAIDSSRMGATGGSYGGFMSNWILGHTNRFKAIATQRSISNWMSMWGTSDIGSFFVDDECKAALLKSDFAPLLEQSPLPGIIKNGKTPTLILHSDEDYRCPVEQAYQLFAVLKEKRIPSKLILFHGENHELSRSGKPLNRIKRLEEITKWMDKYLK